MPRSLLFPVEDVQLTTVSSTTLKNMWEKAERLLNTASSISFAPGNADARMVASDSSPRPHFVQKMSDGKFVCDESCPMWRGRKVCAHTLAVAQDFGCLQQFIAALQKSKAMCSITKLVTTPTDKRKAGTKSGAPKKRRSDMPKTPITVYKSRLDDVSTEVAGVDLSSDSNSQDKHRYPTVVNDTCFNYSSVSASGNSVGSNVGSRVSVGCSSQSFYPSPPNFTSNSFHYFSNPSWYGTDFYGT